MISVFFSFLEEGLGLGFVLIGWLFGVVFGQDLATSH